MLFLRYSLNRILSGRYLVLNVNLLHCKNILIIQIASNSLCGEGGRSPLSSLQLPQPITKCVHVRICCWGEGRESCEPFIVFLFQWSLYIRFGKIKHQFVQHNVRYFTSLRRCSWSCPWARTRTRPWRGRPGCRARCSRCRPPPSSRPPQASRPAPEHTEPRLHSSEYLSSTKPSPNHHPTASSWCHSPTSAAPVLKWGHLLQRKGSNIREMKSISIYYISTHWCRKCGRVWRGSAGAFLSAWCETPSTQCIVDH